MRPSGRATGWCDHHGDYYTGSVFVGTGSYLHNVHAHYVDKLRRGQEQQADDGAFPWLEPHVWRSAQCDQVLESSLRHFDFLMKPQKRAAILAELLPPRGARSDKAKLLVSPDFVALSSVNVVRSMQAQARVVDLQALRRFHEWRTLKEVETEGAARYVPASIDATLGLLRALGPSSFMFVSGIVSHAGVDASTNHGAAAYNAGVTLAFVLGRVQKLFELITTRVVHD